MLVDDLSDTGLTLNKSIEWLKEYEPVKELAKKFVNKTFNPRVIKKMGDEETILYLSELRQIGRWSAEMILLFTYNRSNIWPVQDIGLLRAIS
ncbi:DNA-3-methyladenine glycosylase, partial [Pelagibacteraceae bacterium GOM-A3]